DQHHGEDQRRDREQPHADGVAAGGVDGGRLSHGAVRRPYIGTAPCPQRALVPRTRSSHDFAADTLANFGFKSGTRIIMFASVLSIPKFAQSPRQMLANFGIGTLAAQPMCSLWCARYQSAISSRVAHHTPSNLFT